MTTTLFDSIRWRDPLSGRPMTPIVSARTPGGVPVCGALQIDGTEEAYPIVDCVVRLTPELARRHESWLISLGLKPAGAAAAGETFQPEATVDSFGWQWTWNSQMRSDDDLKMRVADQFSVEPSFFRDQVVLDAGAGAGDQSSYLLRAGARVVSIDLSAAIDVVARKLRMNPSWVGVQGDVTMLPFADSQFDVVYCEGVIQHTRDSKATVAELLRIVRQGGRVLASHYVRPVPRSLPRRIKRKIALSYYEYLRDRLSRMERFKLLFVTGIFASLAYVPIVGRIARVTGTALYYDLMPSFRTTWTNTFDFYGNHAFQRFVSPEEFYSYFEAWPQARLTQRLPGAVVAEKV